ncbi:MAG: zinc ribbon domain-containing protein [Actinomycetota bacterium]
MPTPTSPTRRSKEPSSAVTTHDPVVQAPPPPPAQTKDCPRCAETVKAAAKVCRFCGYEFQEAGSPGQ